MLTPIDIENKEFTKAFRGYDIDEVEEFLHVLVADYEKLYRENASLKDKNAMLQETIGNYRGMEETMQNAILAAQKSADDIKRNAYSRAENIAREAQTRANESIAQADKTIQELENTYLALQGEVDAYRARVRSILETNLKLLDEMPRVEIKTIERVKVDPVTIDPVQHTAPVPDVFKEVPDDLSSTRPVPDISAAERKRETLSEESEPVISKKVKSESFGEERVPLSEKIPVVQSTRGTQVNPVVDQLMQEKEFKASLYTQEPTEAEATPEEATDEFGVKKETFDISSFDVDSGSEVVLSFEKDKKGKKNQTGNGGAYYDVFSDDSL
ncbi:MAG: DivIVA domain-containing protein [Clostridia bacterium]|nr:DivIVA domain-containing protein [Clostridia bacterium]